MQNDLDVLYDRWLVSKNFLAEEMPHEHGLVSNVIPATKFRRLLESASHHVMVQSDDFYQTLRMAHQGDPSANNILDFLLQDLKMLRVELFTFGERYLGDRPASHVKISRNDWGQLTVSIAQRISLEENQLVALLKRNQKAGCQE